MSEAALLARARLGDEDAFTELYQLHIGYVRGIGRGILRRNDVEDVCQDTFLLAFTRLSSFAETSTFRSWITRIAINQCFMALRMRLQVSNGESHLVQMDFDDALDRCHLAVEDMQLQGVAARFDLARLLGALSPGQRELLTMAYLDHMPEGEIAAALGTTTEVVRSRLSRAKRRARNICREE